MGVFVFVPGGRAWSQPNDGIAVESWILIPCVVGERFLNVPPRDERRGIGSQRGGR